jgi:hypothetical protein
MFSVVSEDEKYKAQFAIGTLAHRGGDALGGWLHSLLARSLGLETAIVALIAGGAAVVWSAIALTFTALLRHREKQARSSLTL